jgi:hypothetical protein
VVDRKGADVKESCSCEQDVGDAVAAQRHMEAVGSRVGVVVMIDGVGGAAEECAWDLEAPTVAEDSIVVEVHVSMVGAVEEAEHSLESASGHESPQGLHSARGR